MLFISENMVHSEISKNQNMYNGLSGLLHTCLLCRECCTPTAHVADLRLKVDDTEPHAQINTNKHLEAHAEINL